MKSNNCVKKALCIVVISISLTFYISAAYADNDTGITKEEIPAIPELTATRSIMPPDPIKPGSKILVQIHLRVEKKNIEKLVLAETVPWGWTVVSSTESGMSIDAPKVKWSWSNIAAGWEKEISYELMVPMGISGGEYSFSGDAQAFDDALKTQVVKIEGVESISIETSLVNPLFVAITIAVPILIFLLILFFSWLNDRNLDKGEMRRAIAGTLITGFTVLTIICLYYKIFQNEMILAYIEMVGLVIGFYFGARTAAQKREEEAESIIIENIRFDATKKTIHISVRNIGSNDIKIDKIYINEKPYEKSALISSKISKELEVDLASAYNPATDYQIKVATSNGLIIESTSKSP